MHLKEKLKVNKGLLDVGQGGQMCVYVMHSLHLPELWSSQVVLDLQ